MAAKIGQWDTVVKFDEAQLAEVKGILGSLYDDNIKKVFFKAIRGAMKESQKEGVKEAGKISNLKSSVLKKDVKQGYVSYSRLTGEIKVINHHHGLASYKGNIIQDNLGIRVRTFTKGASSFYDRAFIPHVYAAGIGQKIVAPAGSVESVFIRKKDYRKETSKSVGKIETRPKVIAFYAKLKQKVVRLSSGVNAYLGLKDHPTYFDNSINFYMDRLRKEANEILRRHRAGVL